MNNRFDLRDQKRRVVNIVLHLVTGIRIQLPTNRTPFGAILNPWMGGAMEVAGHDYGFPRHEREL
jgi:hypothetical protein